MSDTGEKRKAAARCERCGEIYPVKIWTDGTIHPLGSADVCPCDETDLRILGDDEPEAGEILEDDLLEETGT